MLILIYSWLLFLFWLLLSFYLLINAGRIKYIRSLKADTAVDPTVTIIIPVRNEEAGLKEALISVCNLSYKNYEVIVVNDRSTDGSTSILADLRKNLSFTLINVTQLPDGWLGKNHALNAGTKTSTADYFLFTDADIVFHEHTLSKAITFAKLNNLDHLTILPEMTTRSIGLRSVLGTFIMMLTTLQRPWAARDKSSKASIGVGAFNLVRKEAYIRAGTHRAIAMRPDDDLQLAAAIKSSGGRSDVLYGEDALQVEWYSNVNEFIEGLMKNAFSGFHYSILKVIGGVIGVLLGYVLPLPLVLSFGASNERVLLLFTILCQLLLFWKLPGARSAWWIALTLPYAGIIMCYIFIRAAYTNTRDGGIYWRGTFYSLTELRKAKRK